MALTVNDNNDPQPQSSYQESGFDGFSADLKHNFINNEETLTKSDQSGLKSSVRPITDALIISGKVCESELQEEPAGKGVTGLAIENNSSPTFQLHLEEEEVRFLPRSDADPERAEESESSTCLEMRKEANQAKGSAVGPKRNRARNGRYRIAKIICCLAAVLLVVGAITAAGLIKYSQPKSSASENNEKNGTASFCGNCFTCSNRSQCPNLISIYRHHDDDNPVYQKTLTEAFPPCDKMTPPANSSCSVCDDHDDVQICCSEDLTEFQAESSKGERIKISNNCTLKSEPPQTGTESPIELQKLF